MTDRRTEGERLRALAADVEMLTAHVEGLTNLGADLKDQVQLMEVGVQGLIDLCHALVARCGEIMAELVVPSKRKVWTVELPEHMGGGQLMIEQFGDKPPTIAHRRHSGETWGPPRQTEVAP